MMRLHLPALAPAMAGELTDDQGKPGFGLWWNSGVIRESGDAPVMPEGSGPLIAWAGGLGKGLFDEDPRTWMSAGWNALERALPPLIRRTADAGSRLVVRPHSRHVVSDGPSAARLLREHPEVGLLLDPAAMLTASMLDTAEDHLERVLALLGEHPAVVGVVLANVRGPGEPTSADIPGPPVNLVALHEGCLDAGMISRLVERYVPVSKARVSPSLYCL